MHFNTEIFKMFHHMWLRKFDKTIEWHLLTRKPNGTLLWGVLGITLLL